MKPLTSVKSESENADSVAVAGRGVGFPCLAGPMSSFGSFGLDDKKDTFQNASLTGLTSTQLESYGSYGREIVFASR